ncbi:glycosyltransferase family 2 protein, partial [Frankia sp. Cr1]|uniref:glycosyltransferase family 2 protein n=1 Tax=Frankia sp. Cr1 TaxID=3073931 RepID=UPI002AD3A39F
MTTCCASAALTRTLAGITAQTVRPADIVVVDNRPRDSGVPALLRRAGLADIRYVAEPAAGLSRARNAGLAAISTPLVVFTDDDIEVDRRWLEFLLAGFVDPRVACATGLIMPLALDTDAQVLFERFGGFGKGFEHHRFDLREHRGDDLLYPFAAGVFGSGANSAFRADVLRALGGFDIRLGAGTRARGGEDLDMHLSVVMAGHALVYEPAALVRHAHRRSQAQLRRQVHGYGIGLGAMVTKRLLTRPRERRELLRRAPHGLRHMVDPNSPKNLGKQHGYPRSLSAAELAGIVRGPGAYLANALLDRPAPAATTGGSASANRLIWCGEVELAAPTVIPPEPLDAAGEPYREARVLIRLHGTPLGFLHVDLDEDVLDDVTVRALAAGQLGDAIRAHL